MESSSQLRNCDIVFVLGPPGSGKGTICRAVVNSRTKIGNIFYHLSVGDYLRELTSPNGPYHNIGSGRATIRKHILDNKLVPAGLLIPVLCSEIHIRQGAGVDGITVAWLIDGFPRNMETALAFEERMGKPNGVIILECARETARCRYLKRRREETDDDAKFEKRFDEYVENMKAIRKHYEGNIKTVCVDGSIDDYFNNFLNALPWFSKDQ